MTGFNKLRAVKIRTKKTGDRYQLTRFGETARLVTETGIYYFPSAATHSVDTESDPDYIWITCLKTHVRDYWLGEVFDLSGAPYKWFDI